MKRIYPIVLKPEGEGGYVISVPDLSIDTQGDTLAEAIDMARDAISLTCIDLEDDHKPTPAPSRRSRSRCTVTSFWRLPMSIRTPTAQE